MAAGPAARRPARGGGPDGGGRRRRWCRADTSPGDVAKVQRGAIVQVIRSAPGDGQEVLDEVGRAGFFRPAQPLVVFDGQNHDGGGAPAGDGWGFAVQRGVDDRAEAVFGVLQGPRVHDMPLPG